MYDGITTLSTLLRSDTLVPGTVDWILEMEERIIRNVRKHVQGNVVLHPVGNSMNISSFSMSLSVKRVEQSASFFNE